MQSTQTIRPLVHVPRSYAKRGLTRQAFKAGFLKGYALALAYMERGEKHDGGDFPPAPLELQGHALAESAWKDGCVAGTVQAARDERMNSDMLECAAEEMDALELREKAAESGRQERIDADAMAARDEAERGARAVGLAVIASVLLALAAFLWVVLMRYGKLLGLALACGLACAPSAFAGNVPQIDVVVRAAEDEARLRAQTVCKLTYSRQSALGEMRGSGTAFFADLREWGLDHRHALTAAHNVVADGREKTLSLEVLTPAGVLQIPAVVVKRDAKLDLALLRVDRADRSVLSLGIEARTGAALLLCGCRGGEPMRAHPGRLIEKFFAGASWRDVMSIETKRGGPGLSGGPVLDAGNRLVGVLVASPDNPNYAGPDDDVYDVARGLYAPLAAIHKFLDAK